MKKYLKNNKGLMLVLSSPSGAGKSSICRSLLSLDNNLNMSISTTTREKRSNEIDGNDYFFVDENKFNELLIKDYFIEHAKVFGNYYGTEKKLLKIL